MPTKTQPVLKLRNMTPYERQNLQYGDIIACLLTLDSEQVWMLAGKVRDVSLDGTLVVYEQMDGSTGWLTGGDWCARWRE